MRVAVVGASGVAGRAFVDVAAAAGHTLVTDRVDILDEPALRAFLAGCDAAVNLATSIPRPGGRGSWERNDRIRREGTMNLLAAARHCGVKIVVQQSVAMLHCVDDTRPQQEDDPIEGYGVLASAYDMERIVRSAPGDCRLVRGALFYGPGTYAEERWLAQLRDPEFRLPGDGSAWLSLIHVGDFATALLFVLERGAPRGAYIASEERPWRLRELYASLAMREGAPEPRSGGAQGARSFRVTSAKLRSLGWRPAHDAGALLSGRPARA